MSSQTPKNSEPKNRAPTLVKLRPGLRVQYEPEENVKLWGIIQRVGKGVVVIAPDDCDDMFSCTNESLYPNDPDFPTFLETIAVEVEGWSTDGKVYGESGVFIGPGSKVWMYYGETTFYNCTVVEKGNGPKGTCIVRVDPVGGDSRSFAVCFPIRHLLADANIKNL